MDTRVKVLWICNIMLPVIAEKLGMESSNKEGWLDGLCNTILARGQENQIELHVAYPVGPADDGSFHALETEKSRLFAYGFYEDMAHAERYDAALEKRLAGIIKRVQPDVIHCFGTEFAHTLAALRVCPSPDRVLVGIQGVCSVIAQSYMADLPREVQEKKSFRDWLKRDGLKEQQQKFRLRGLREREILKLAGNIIGRTAFDRAYAQECHKEAVYFHMNETLRPDFYKAQWSLTDCEPHTIFLSQGDYPVKGLHYMLLAAGKIKKSYPDLQIRVAGNSLVNYTSVKDKIKISGYGKYLRKLLAENDLESCVHFLGKLTAEEMKREYLQSNLYVCCSSNENSPNSLGEAMLLGVPCVAADVGGIPSLFTAEKDGILYEGYRLYENKYNNTCDEKNKLKENAVRLADAVLRMWNDADKLLEYCKNARIHAKKTHDAENNYQKLIEIYANVAARHSRICFVSNYINHHQIPFCNAMDRLTGGNFHFIQTQPMEEERILMGWNEKDAPSYVRYYYREEDFCKKEIRDCDVVLFGGCDEEYYIEERLKTGRTVIRISERLYKTGQWKAVSPRGLLQKYKDHTRYRSARVYLLCAGAYVASDFHIVRAYPGKMFCWGYFPETKAYDLDALMAGKGYAGQASKRAPYLLWAGRFIDWKHPELALETARYLRKKGLDFHLDMIGGGDMEETIKSRLREYGLEDYVSLLGFQPPDRVRQYMEKADIFLFTSDRQEGWGAVVNEAMNSGCAVVAGSLPGSVPYLIRQNENGFIYPDKKRDLLYPLVENLVRDAALCQETGRKAYDTITREWNAENAAGRLYELIEKLMKGEERKQMNTKHTNLEHSNVWEKLIPCAPAPVLEERDFPK